jgi:hypothetical protein
VITVVSGLPRSGTSLLMQMLAAGGFAVLSDGLRPPDEDNPRGYLEWERIRTLAKDPTCIAEAEGKAVKVISSLLPYLPMDREYKILFMRRPLGEVVASQGLMLARRGSTGPAIKPDAITGALEAHLKQVTAWLHGQPRLAVRWVDHRNLLLHAGHESTAIAEFLSIPLDIVAMSKQVVPSLHRQRSEHPNS